MLFKKDFSMFGYNEASAAASTCSSDSCRRPSRALRRPSVACSRSDTCPWRRWRSARLPPCACRRDIASRRGWKRDENRLSDRNEKTNCHIQPTNSHRFWCKQECSLPTTSASSSAPFRSRFCGNSCSPAPMFCCWSFWRKNIYSNVASDTFSRLRDKFVPRTRMSQACWCHHLRKVRDAHETVQLIKFETSLPQTVFTGQQFCLSYCFIQYWTCWLTGGCSVHFKREQ